MRVGNVIVSAIVALSALALPTAAAAQSKPKSQMLPNAIVKTVSATSVVVTGTGSDTTFAVDARTQVVGKGVGTKSKAKGNKSSIADLLKPGDRVTVRYQDVGGTLRASTIEVTPQSAK